MGMFSDTYTGEYGSHKISIIGKSGLRASFELHIDGKLVDSGKANLSNSNLRLELHGLIQEDKEDKAVIVQIEHRSFEGLIPKLIVNNVQLPLKKK